jgi:hypothetical protein
MVVLRIQFSVWKRYVTLPICFVRILYFKGTLTTQFLNSTQCVFSCIAGEIDTGQPRAGRFSQTDESRLASLLLCPDYAAP